MICFLFLFFAEVWTPALLHSKEWDRLFRRGSRPSEYLETALRIGMAPRGPHRQNGDPLCKALLCSAPRGRTHHRLPLNKHKPRKWWCFFALHWFLLVSSHDALPGVQRSRNEIKVCVSPATDSDFLAIFPVVETMAPDRGSALTLSPALQHRWRRLRRCWKRWRLWTFLWRWFRRRLLNSPSLHTNVDTIGCNDAPGNGVTLEQIRIHDRKLASRLWAYVGFRSVHGHHVLTA